MIHPKKPITMTVVPYEPPDHPWDETLAVADQWCGICGKSKCFTTATSTKYLIG